MHKFVLVMSTYLFDAYKADKNFAYLYTEWASWYHTLKYSQLLVPYLG